MDGTSSAASKFQEASLKVKFGKSQVIQHARILPFVPERRARERQVGRVHRDGSISFRGETYREWKRIYRAIAPARCQARPDWTVIK